MFYVRNPNGFGGINYLGKGRRRPYRVRITVGWSEDGRQMYKTVGYATTKKEAIMLLSDYNKEPFSLDRDNTTFADVYKKWYESKENKLDEKNLKGYHYAFKLCEDIHDAKFVDLRKSHLQAMLDNIEKSVASKNKIKSLLRQIYILAMDMDLVTKNYSEGLELTSQIEKMNRSPFSPDEINKLWELSKDSKFARLVLILIYTGMRINELLKMETANVHLDERYMIGGSKTDAGKDRLIPIADKIHPFISELYDENNRLLLVSSRGGKMSYQTFYHPWLKFMTEHGFDHLIHDTRVTFASLAHAAGVNELNLKRILGHSNSGNITHHYIKTDVELLLEEVNKL